ncbi:hypothetical protein FHX08_005983 [Rhizobium sp. BK529]|uniref:hypothetical protein n=1 Tax=unclassified Rhizobium TaxID=2613769 RepID=UPI001044F6E7|nr:MULTISPECIES: hypothetical protein [unclassified Rhizobium]MBB3595571.1 hypothetical protein [Rhizobium sp. BK529]TCS00639.1 hypothetical protein EV281_10772 [Rhizobium sp. BK418]
MQLATVSASSILRGAMPAQSGVSSTGEEPDTGVLKIQRQSLALEQVRNSLASSADDAKSRAQRKLEDAKQELQALKTAGFPPEVIARLAAELARKVGAAASEFASAVATGGSSGAATSASSTASAAATTDAAEIATADAVASDATASAETTQDTETRTGETQDSTNAAQTDGAAHARRAYQEIVEDGLKSSTISTDDRKTMEEFKSIVRELKQVLEKAMRDLREKNRDAAAEGAIGAAQSAVTSLSATVPTATIPSSIVV